jgi:hypothetical protein
MQVYWASARYTVNENLTAVLAYYGEKQNAYATGPDLNCSSASTHACDLGYRSRERRTLVDDPARNGDAVRIR